MGWFELPFFRKGTHNYIWERVYNLSHGRVIPERPYWAFELTPQEKTKVLVLGQDPYPTPGHAHGLAFSVRKSVNPLPRSLQNIFKELVDDLGVPYPANGDLTPWAKQGVLLLNTCLTVAPFQPNSHKDMGWEDLAKEVVEYLSNETERRVFILWGRQAQAFEPLVDKTKHLVIASPHPSPLSAHSGFFGSKPFSRANEYLESPIDWGLNGSETPGSLQPTP